MSSSRKSQPDALSNSLPPGVSIILTKRIEAVTTGATPAERRAAARLLIRDLELMIRAYPGPCPMQRYCLAGCAMMEHLGYEVETRKQQRQRAAERYAGRAGVMRRNWDDRGMGHDTGGEGEGE